MKKSLIFFLCLIVFAACNKDKQAVKQLDGTWEAESVFLKVEFGEFKGSVDLLQLDSTASATFEFNECKMKNDNYCNGSLRLVQVDSTIADDFLFKVVDDGTTIETLVDGDKNEISLDELSKTDCTLHWIRDTLDLTFYLKKV